MARKIKTIIKIFGQAIISAILVFILISAPVRRVLSAVKYTLDSSDVISNITSTGVLTIGSAAVDSFLRLYPTDTVPCAQEGAMYYSCASSAVKFYDGTGWINLAEAAEASGQIAMFDGACPSGWTEVTTFQNKFPRGHDADATYCETGGSDTVSVTVDVGSTTSAECGSHAHTVLLTWTCADLNCAVRDPYVPPCTYTSRLCGAHTHTVDPAGVASTSCSNIPAFREVVFCKKD